MPPIKKNFQIPLTHLPPFAPIYKKMPPIKKHYHLNYHLKKFAPIFSNLSIPNEKGIYGPLRGGWKDERNSKWITWGKDEGKAERVICVWRKESLKGRKNDWKEERKAESIKGRLKG